MTTLDPTTRYFAPEITKVIWFDADGLADYTNPTHAEIEAGVFIQDEIAALSGWLTTSASIETPDMGSRFKKKIGGRTDIADSSLTFYADQRGVDVRTLAARGDRGFIAFMDGGYVTGQPMDIYPVFVASIGKDRSTDDKAAQLQIQYTITSVPAEDVEIPASA